MERFTVLVVDDEPLARRGIRRQIEGLFPGAVTSEASHADEALAAVAASAPDLMLLDIEMPGMSAFDLLRSLPEGDLPRVVLVTAYDEFALEAFEAGALDYVLKPVDPERLRTAVERALRFAAEAPASAARAASPERITVRVGGRVRVIDPAEIEWIEAAGSYVKLHTRSGEVLHRASLTAMTEILDAAAFIRIHRGTVVAVAQISEVRPLGRGDASLRLKSGTELTASRRYRGALAAALRRWH